MAFKNNCAIKNKSLRGFCAKQKLRNNVQQQQQFLLVQHSMVFSCSITIKKKEMQQQNPGKQTYKRMDTQF